MKFLNLFRVSLIFAFFHPPVGFSSPTSFGPIRPQHSWSILAPDSAKPRLDVSGLVRVQNQFLIVSDRYEYQDIYKLDPVDGKSFQAREYLSPQRSRKNKSERPHLDLEGIAYCAGFFYLVDEEHQMLMEVDAAGSAKEHVLDLRSIHKQKKSTFASGTDSAGLEGVACDEGTKTLFVANERQFRMIYTVDLASWKITDFFDVPSGWDFPQTQNGVTIFQDYSDLHFADGFLYALQRIDRQVLKIDPKTKNLVASLQLQFSEKELYETKEPYGMSEGLFVDKNKIYIALDNNGMKQKGSQQINGLLLEFRRPKGF